MSYVDGFVIPIAKEKLKDYEKMAKEGKKIWMKCGAVAYYECIGDDLTPASMGGPVGTFTKMAKLKEGETVIFSFVVFKSRAHRDAVNKKVNKAMGELYADVTDFVMPFNQKRMAVGGFKTFVQG